MIMPPHTSDELYLRKVSPNKADVHLAQMHILTKGISHWKNLLTFVFSYNYIRIFAFKSQLTQVTNY
jgi:hypothetical protein